MADDRTFRQLLVEWAIGRLQRALQPTSRVGSPPGFNWVSAWGNGDRGPPGSWQMNANAPHRGVELIAFSAVYACVNTIAADIAKLPVEIFEVDLDDGARTVRRRDYYAELFRRPNDYQTGADFLQVFVQSYLLQGNTYCWIAKRNGRGEPAELHVLNPHKVKVLITEGGQIFYECAEDFLAGIVPNQVIPERDMVHHRLPLLPGYPLVGVTPIFAAAASSALGIQILRDSQTFFGNASRPAGLLSSEQHISDDLAKRYQQEWDDAYRGRDIGKTAVLGGGMKWQPLTITAQDAQLIEQLRYSVEDVARVFRVPPFMLGDMSKVTYRNTEMMQRAYLSGCLSWHLEALQQRFEYAFSFEPQFQIRFDLSAMLRTEIDVRYAAYQQGLAGGWLAPNEVRAQEGLPPAEGGDEPRMQSQYVPLSQASEPPADPAPVPAPAPEPPAPDEEASFNPARVRQLVRERLRRAA
ncbi:MAG TPA: phage portal protein [Reyranella sp.]|nr:phage portal protein [Reyranella sp.]